MSLWKKIWLRLRYITAEAAANALIAQSDQLHTEARAESDPKLSAVYRAEAEYLSACAKEVRDALHDGPHNGPHQ